MKTPRILLSFPLIAVAWVTYGQSDSELQRIDSLIAHFYTGVSFNDSQWKAAENIEPIFYTDSRIIANFGAAPQVNTIKEFIASVRANINRQNIISVNEREIYSSTDVFGKVAQRLSTYEIKFTFNGKENLIRRGVNLIQLINDRGKWKISSIVWDRESDQLKIPREFLQH